MRLPTALLLAAAISLTALPSAAEPSGTLIPALEPPNVYDGVKSVSKANRDSWYWGFDIGFVTHFPVELETPDYVAFETGLGFGFTLSIDFLERFQALFRFRVAIPGVDNDRIAKHFNYSRSDLSGDYMSGGIEGRWFPVDVNVGSGGTILRPFVGLMGGGGGFRSTDTDYNEETEETYTWFRASYGAGYLGPVAGLRLDIPVPDFFNKSKNNFVTVTLDAQYQRNFFSDEVITEDDSEKSKSDISDQLSVDSLFFIFSVGMLL